MVMCSVSCCSHGAVDRPVMVMFSVSCCSHGAVDRPVMVMCSVSCCSHGAVDRSKSTNTLALSENDTYSLSIIV